MDTPVVIKPVGTAMHEYTILCFLVCMVTVFIAIWLSHSHSISLTMCTLSHTWYSSFQWQAPKQFNYNYHEQRRWTFSHLVICWISCWQEEPFPKASDEQVMNYVRLGGIWQVPSKYYESTHPFDAALWQAVEVCLKFVPSEQPSVQQVADFLRKARDEFKSKK